MTQPKAPPNPQPPPDSLATDGRFRLGRFTRPPRNVNPLEASFPVHRPWPYAFKKLRLKQWQHFALVTPEFFLTLALFDAKWMGLGQIVFQDRRRKRSILFEKKFIGPQLKLPSSHWRADAEIQRDDFGMRIENRLEEGFHRVEFRSEGPRIEGEILCLEEMDRREPLAVCLPLPNGGALYSHKALLPAEGSVRLGEETHRIDPGRSFVLTDIHHGYYPYSMKWLWATAAGFDAEGKLNGFNLTRNQVVDRDRYNENGLWLDGKLHPLPDVVFELDRERASETPWRIRDREGRVDLTFQPEGAREVDLGVGPFRSRYRGPHGAFEGTLALVDGTTHRVENLFGMCEDFFLRA